MSENSGDTEYDESVHVLLNSENENGELCLLLLCL